LRDPKFNILIVVYINYYSHNTKQLTSHS